METRKQTEQPGGLVDFTHGGCCAVLLRSHMRPLISPVISGEEDRGVWSSNKKQKKNLQVDQEQRSNIFEVVREKVSKSF